MRHLSVWYRFTGQLLVRGKYDIENAQALPASSQELPMADFYYGHQVGFSLSETVLVAGEKYGNKIPICYIPSFPTND